MERRGNTRKKSDKLVETCIRLFPADAETIKQSDTLKVGVVCRTLVHNYLQSNGHSQMDLMRRINIIDDKMNKLEAEKVVYEHRLKEMFDKKFTEEEEILDEERRTLYLAQLKTLWAEQLFTLRKSSSLRGKVREEKEDIVWVSSKMKTAKEFKDLTGTPEIVLGELESIMSSKAEEFEGRFDAEYRGG